MRKKIINYFLPTLPGICLFGFVFISCHSKEGNTAKETPKVYFAKYAEGFVIKDFSRFKVIEFFLPGESGNKVSKYVLYKRGTPKPDYILNASFIETPVRSFVALSSMYIAYAEKLGLAPLLKGVSDKSHIYDPQILTSIEEGKVAEVGSENAVDIEKILKIKPELIVTYSSGNTQPGVHSKLQEAGMKLLANAEHLESSPLGRMEWIKVFAAFFERETLADSVFNETEKKYLSLKRIAASALETPGVMVDIRYGDTWFMPGGKSFVATLLHDAHSDYVWKNDPHHGSIALDFESVYVKANSMDFWINTGSWNNIEDVLAADARYGNFKVIRSGNIYNYVKRIGRFGGNDFWESGFLNPDMVLADLIKIFHPYLLPQHELYYYQQLKHI